MNRKKFISHTLWTGIVGTIAPSLLQGSKRQPLVSTYDELMETIGFNLLPNKNIESMNTIIHRADSRGSANHGWLQSQHTFSFANYHNPERMHFGVLRVLNDDIVQAGMGFGTHPHDNMEIISIPLSGDLEHKDSMGNITVIKEGDVQAMSAGTGVTHSEYNKNKDKDVQFLQIWVFPKNKNTQPQYDQLSLQDIAKQNAFYQIASPNKAEQGVTIHQDAWFHIGDFTAGNAETYPIKKEGNGVYAFIIDGAVTIEGETLSRRDGMGIWDTDTIHITAVSDARILLMEVPMNL